MEDKHAYLIMAHNNFGQLKKLLQLLDDERNEIYLHIDRKTEVSADLLRELKTCVSKSKLIMTKRVRVTWGGFSQIRTELVLLQAATKTYHSRYHLISGVDMPIKPQDEIHAFFAAHPDEEFVCHWISSQAPTRIEYYHFLQEFQGRDYHSHRAHRLKKIEVFLLNWQKRLGINRLKHCPKIYKGSNWFSITHEFARYILSQKRKIRKLFGFSRCADELFMQTIGMNSHFAEKIVDGNYRLIDWERGDPYTFHFSDYDEIMASSAFFVRKVSEQVDPALVDAIFNTLRTPQLCAEQKKNDKNSD